MGAADRGQPSICRQVTKESSWATSSSSCNSSPALITALKAIEEAIPGSGKGEQKLSAIRGILEAVDGSITSLWPQISSVISVLVTLFNNTGIFKKA